MLKRADRTMERYTRAGAMMRLYKTVTAKMVTAVSMVVSASDQDKMIRAMGKIDEVCSNAEDNMFRDHRDLSSDYIDVFYGSTYNEPRNGVDRQVLDMAKEAVDELFDGARH